MEWDEIKKKSFPTIKENIISIARASSLVSIQWLLDERNLHHENAKGSKNNTFDHPLKWWDQFRHCICLCC